MSSPATSALRDEITAALKVLNPQVRGLDELLLLKLSGPTRAVVSSAQVDTVRRRNLCQDVLNALDALDADDYPNMQKHVLSAASEKELQGDLGSIKSALDEFEAEPVASVLTIDLGDTSTKTS